MKLYICGNGFDQHHNLPTSYKKYKEHLQKHYPHIYRGYNNFPYLLESLNADKWEDIEYALRIDYDELFYQSVNEFYPDMNNDSDSRWDEIDIDIENLTNFINDFTGRAFIEWILNAENYPSEADLDLDKEALYINFNYTNTLQRLYNISENSILHIHGALRKLDFNNILEKDILPRFSTVEEAEVLNVIARADEWNNEFIRNEIQFGATGITAEQVRRDLYEQYGKDDFYSVSIKSAIDKLADFVEKSTKNPKKNFDSLVNFIDGKEIDEVIVMGVSLGEADDLYYTNVLVPKFKNKKWIFMQYGKDASHIYNFINKHSLLNTDIKKW